MQLLRDDCSINAIRLRVWVNPAEGCNNTANVTAKVLRAHRLGQRLMIDFHFSDTWANPGAQITPAAWKDLPLKELKQAMADHITEMLTSLKRQGITPEWVQLGNGTRNGMIYPLGTVDQLFAELIDYGYVTVKGIFPKTKVIVHMDCGNQLDLYTYLFGYLEREHTRYDLIGMALYPNPDHWKKAVYQCLANIQTLHFSYRKRIAIAEIGMDCRAATADQMLRTLTQGCLDAQIIEGIFWWKPEVPAEEGYPKGYFYQGTPTQALDIFKELSIQDR